MESIKKRVITVRKSGRAYSTGGGGGGRVESTQ